ncbi:Flavonol 4'-sulfotransferase [Labeo rohita]|uniref:Flavonol 4'-sulfotransferase n=1 Tax=Labeo rohita TaxID=84645 RepID=A0ABQ8LBS9_LABRO|nr:Flavonol 4'-sulfotransferase [Labeo rohita]
MAFCVSYNALPKYATLLNCKVIPCFQCLFSDKPPNDISVSAHAPEEDVPSLPNLSCDNPFHGLQQLIEQSEQRVLLAIERMQSDIANSIEHLVQTIQQNRPGPSSFTTPPQETMEGPCKTTQFLSLVGGSSIGDAVRRILRKVATNEAWSNYSLKGRKGKLPFMGTSLHHIVLSKLFTVSLFLLLVHATVLKTNDESCLLGV